jgi:hypothetical protein
MSFRCVGFLLPLLGGGTLALVLEYDSDLLRVASGTTETKMKTILITGAAGNIGGQLRRQFAGKYKLRLSDKRLLTPSSGETFVHGDIVDMAEALAMSERGRRHRASRRLRW